MNLWSLVRMFMFCPQFSVTMQHFKLLSCNARTSAVFLSVASPTERWPHEGSDYLGPCGSKFDHESLVPQLPPLGRELEEAQEGFNQITAAILNQRTSEHLLGGQFYKYWKDWKKSGHLEVDQNLEKKLLCCIMSMRKTFKCH